MEGVKITLSDRKFVTALCFQYEQEIQVIRFFLKEQIADKEFRENRRITLDEVSRETGISRNTLSRIANSRGVNTTSDNLDRLCKYFSCTLADLAVYIEDE
jgi:putative transcriptional regulator